jgi:hypothetical protein
LDLWRRNDFYDHNPDHHTQASDSGIDAKDSGPRLDAIRSRNWRIRLIIGIDPGQSTGIATFVDGKLTSLKTIEPAQLFALMPVVGIERVIFEDSRLQSHVWTTNISRPAALKMARNLGQVDAWCGLITAMCAELGIAAHGISPRGKGAKLDAVRFEALTGWDLRSNQHERDAAMVAWPYRGAK